MLGAGCTLLECVVFLLLTAAVAGLSLGGAGGGVKRAAILGASGYTGAELMSLLSVHPHVPVDALTSTDRNAGQEFKVIFPQFAYRNDLPKLTLWEESRKQIEACDVAFCCLPHGTTQEIIQELATASPSIKIVDLSADFRLKDVNSVQSCAPHTLSMGIRVHPPSIIYSTSHEKGLQ